MSLKPYGCSAVCIYAIIFYRVWVDLYIFVNSTMIDIIAVCSHNRDNNNKIALLVFPRKQYIKS